MIETVVPMHEEFDVISSAFLPIGKECPKCGSAEWDDASTFGVFVVRKPRRCSSCQTAYLPAFSRILAFVVLCIGIGLIAVSGLNIVETILNVSVFSVLVDLMVLGMGLVTVVCGWRFLTYRTSTPTCDQKTVESLGQAEEATGPIHFQCSFCKAEVEQPREQMGIMIECPKCNANIIVPSR